MNKKLVLFLVPIALLSCTNIINSEPKLELPKYAISEENFTSTINDADSTFVEFSYEEKTNWLYSSSANKLVVKVYFNTEKSLKHDFLEKQFDEIKSNANKQILNLSAYDILEVQFFNKNIQIQSFEEILKK